MLPGRNQESLDCWETGLTLRKCDGKAGSGSYAPTRVAAVPGGDVVVDWLVEPTSMGITVLRGREVVDPVLYWS